MNTIQFIVPHKILLFEQNIIIHMPQQSVQLCSAAFKLQEVAGTTLCGMLR